MLNNEKSIYIIKIKYLFNYVNHVKRLKNPFSLKKLKWIGFLSPSLNFKKINIKFTIQGLKL